MPSRCKVTIKRFDPLRHEDRQLLTRYRYTPVTGGAPRGVRFARDFSADLIDLQMMAMTCLANAYLFLDDDDVAGARSAFQHLTEEAYDIIICSTIVFNQSRIKISAPSGLPRWRVEDFTLSQYQNLLKNGFLAFFVCSSPQ